MKHKLFLKALNKYYFLFGFSLFSTLVNAQLPPTPSVPGGGGANGNFLSFMQAWSAEAVDYIALVISAAGFLWVGWILLSKFNEARSSNDPDWGSVGLTAVIAGVLLVVVTYFLTQSTGILGTATTTTTAPTP